jgi:hypothetical protein
MHFQNEKGLTLVEITISIAMMIGLGLVTVNYLIRGNDLQKYLEERLAGKSIYEKEVQSALLDTYSCDYTFLNKKFKEETDGSLTFLPSQDLVVYADVKVAPPKNADNIPNIETGEGDLAPTMTGEENLSAMEEGDSTESASVDSVPPGAEDTSESFENPSETEGEEPTLVDELFTKGKLLAKKDHFYDQAIRVKDVNVSRIVKLVGNKYLLNLDIELNDKNSKSIRSYVSHPIVIAEPTLEDPKISKITGCFNKTRSSFDKSRKNFLKIPPIRKEIYYPDKTRWKCEKVDIEEHCADDDGCTIKANMQHEAYYDQVRVYKGRIFLEDIKEGGFSNNTYKGIYGWTTFESGGYAAYLLNLSTNRYNLFSPWSWMYVLNYDHSYCWVEKAKIDPVKQWNYTYNTSPTELGSMAGKPGPGYTNEDKYKINVLVNPNVKLRLEIYD